MNPRYEKEHQLIQKTGAKPVTGEDIRSTLQSLGIGRGDVIMLHGSMSRIGWTVGGSITVLNAVFDLIGDAGTLVMPAHSNDLSDPIDWENPPVPEAWKPIIREHMPPYDRNTSSCRRLGELAESFRTYPGVIRSDHPHFSVSALGSRAEFIAGLHDLNYSMGKHSPYGRLYDLKAKIVLFAVTFDNCSLLHLAEYLADWKGKTIEQRSAPVGRNEGKTVWQLYDDLQLNSDDFIEIGNEFVQQHPEYAGHAALGLGDVKVLSAKPIVDFAVAWMNRHR